MFNRQYLTNYYRSLKSSLTILNGISLSTLADLPRFAVTVPALRGRVHGNDSCTVADVGAGAVARKTPRAAACIDRRILRFVSRTEHQGAGDVRRYRRTCTRRCRTAGTARTR